ncbi:Apoptosis-inducing factor 2 [Aphanomyces cochlioides]|nr:Apoptosis-inducing factor 2 [Aphanomyces cochlioides]
MHGIVVERSQLNRVLRLSWCRETPQTTNSHVVVYVQLLEGFQFSAIVVVSGGYVGIRFAQELAKQLPAKIATITVVEKNDFTFHCVGVPRALVDPSFVKQLFIPLKHALPYPHVKIVRGIAEEIQDKHVVVRQIVNDQAEGTTTNIPFDYLVLATGSSYASPIKVANGHFRAASSVLVVGGGPVGIEVAAEIAYAYPSKRVTILEGNLRLIHNLALKDSFRQQLSAKLAQLNVEVVLGATSRTCDSAQFLRHDVGD